MRNNFKLNPLVLAMAVCALPMSTFAQDKSTDNDTIEEVVVTGSFRESLANALNIKRNNAGAVDAIVADDIASFPDNNLAESLQRIPGVAIERVAGEGRQISVRGLGAGFTRTRINGMEAVATGGATDAAGGTNRDRNFDFNTFASELFSSLTVRKTASADVEEGSLGATVDLKAAQPFDFDGFTMAASGQLGYNDRSESNDPKVSFLVSNTFADDTVGALLSVAYSKREIKDEGASTVRWDNSNDFGSYQGNTDLTATDLKAINEGFRPRIPRYDSYTHEMDRLGISGSLQFRPTDTTEISLDGLYAKYDATRNEVFMEAVLNSTGSTKVMDVTSYTLDNTNTVTAASFTNATIKAENRYDELSTDFTQITLSGKHEFTDALRMDALIGNVVSEFDNPVQTTVISQKTGMDFAYDYTGSYREDPKITFDDEVSNLDGWSNGGVRLRPQSAKNTYDAALANLEYDLNDSLSYKGGVNYKKFDFEATAGRRNPENNGDVVLTSDMMMTYDSGLGTNNPWAIPDLKAINNKYNIYSGTGIYEVPERKNDVAAVSEESLGFFVQAKFETQIGDTDVRGDIGVRQVDTDIESQAYDSKGVLQTGSYSYSNTLPSINLVFEPIEDVLIRMSYAEVVSRAGLGSLLPNTNVSVAGSNRTVASGNPALDPTKAASYDLGLELYLSEESVIGVAVFYKDIDTFVQTIKQTRPFTTTGLASQIAINECAVNNQPADSCNANVDWNVSSPVNAPGGDLYGFELSYQTPFTALPGIWSNFGFMGNFTYVEAQQDYINQDGVVTATNSLLGLSKDTMSGTLYYEDEAFSTRISAVHRAGYLTDANGRNGNVQEGTNATTNIDMAASYQFNEHIKFTLEALNLTDEADDQWVDNAGNRLSYYHNTGRQYYLGVSYKY
jgi:iron complex outermembrane recepter protein